LELRGTNLRLTPKGMDLQNTVLVDMM